MPIADVKRAALALTRAGVQIRLISPLLSARGADRRNMIQVGSLREGEPYGSTTLRARPCTADEIRAATSFPLREPAASR